jgi:catechol 2,3-dioxygenase-like lactoylglutathione lyase family enzyme
MPRIFDHVDLRVRDLAAAGPFYRQLLPLLGFTVRVDIPGWLQFEAPGPGADEFFGVTEDRNHRPNRSRIAFWASSPARLDGLAATLPGIGAANIEGPGFESKTYYAVYFDDPSGNPLEICHRTKPFTPVTAAKSNVTRAT